MNGNRSDAARFGRTYALGTGRQRCRSLGTTQGLTAWSLVGQRGWGVRFFHHLLPFHDLTATTARSAAGAGAIPIARCPQLLTAGIRAAVVPQRLAAGAASVARKQATQATRHAIGNGVNASSNCWQNSRKARRAPVARAARIAMVAARADVVAYGIYFEERPPVLHGQPHRDQQPRSPQLDRDG